jgi:hypothetical protein
MWLCFDADSFRYQVWTDLDLQKVQITDTFERDEETGCLKYSIEKREQIKHK